MQGWGEGAEGGMDSGTCSPSPLRTPWDTHTCDSVSQSPDKVPTLPLCAEDSRCSHGGSLTQQSRGAAGRMLGTRILYILYAEPHSHQVINDPTGQNQGSL